MAAELKAVMEGVATALSPIPGLRTSDHVPGQINPPQAVVMVPPVDYDQGFGRTRADLIVTVTVLVSAAMDQQGQHLLAGYAEISGDQSVKAAIEKDRTLGGVVEDCRVSRFNPIGLTNYGSLAYIGGEFRIPVMVR